MCALHAFARGARGSVRQAPLTNAPMGHRRRGDYPAVLGAARKLTALVMGSDIAFRLAAGEVFPFAKRLGRFIHWRLCGGWKAQRLRAPITYEPNPDMRHYRSPLRTLPRRGRPPRRHLPLNAVQASPVVRAPRLEFSTMFTAESWSVFGRAVGAMKSTEWRRQRLRGLP